MKLAKTLHRIDIFQEEKEVELNRKKA